MMPGHDLVSPYITRIKPRSLAEAQAAACTRLAAAEAELRAAREACIALGALPQIEVTGPPAKRPQP